MISSLDHGLIAIYFLGVLTLGLWVKSPKDARGYIFAGRKLTVPAFVLTLVSTWYGGILEVGRFTHLHGISTILVFGLFYYIAAILYAYLLVPKISNGDFQTIPDAISGSFGRGAGLLAAIVVLFISSPAPYIKILSTILGFLYGFSAFHAALICAFISILYTIRGGFYSVVRTDMIQFVMMFTGFAMILIFLYSSYGGYAFLSSSLPERMLSFPGDLNWSYIIIWGFIAMVTFIDPNFYQRTFAGASSRDVQKGICVSVSLWFVFDLMSICTGLYAAAIIPEVNHSPYLDLVSVTLPPVLQGLFIISLLSVVMSTVDSFLFVSGFTIGKDILPILSESRSDKTVNYTRIGIIISGVISVILATFFENALDIWYVSGSFAVSCLLLPLICVLYRVNLRFSIATIIIPMAVTLLWFCFGYPEIDPMYPGLASSVLCFLIFR